MVFPLGAPCVMELAVDHLDRLLGKSRLDRLVHESGVAQDCEGAGTDEPEECAKGTCEEGQRQTDDQETGVELRRSGTEAGDLEIVALKLSNSPHTTGDEDDGEEQSQVSEKGVDGEHDDNGGIVAGEVAQVVVPSALDFTEVGRFGDALEIEEFADSLEISEAGAKALLSQTIEATAE